MPRLLFLAVLVVLMPPMAGAARAGEGPYSGAPLDRAEEYARKSIENLFRSFDTLLQAVPRYGAPRLDDNGNIVIPREPLRPAPPLAPDNPIIRT